MWVAIVLGSVVAGGQNWAAMGCAPSCGGEDRYTGTLRGTPALAATAMSVATQYAVSPRTVHKTREPRRESIDTLQKKQQIRNVIIMNEAMLAWFGEAVNNNISRIEKILA
jgi:hypothetical protein